MRDEHELSAHSRLLWNSALFTAGHVLTSGGILAYFASELGARTVQMAWLLTLPELAATAGVFAHRLARRAGRRSVWRVASLISLGALAGIPLLASGNARSSGTSVLLAIIAVSSAARGIGFVALLSWMADLVPEARWGRFFAGRNIAHVLVMLLLPAVVGCLRDWASSLGQPALVRLVYAGSFSAGAGLLALATAVIWGLPEPERRVAAESSEPVPGPQRVHDRRSLTLLIGFSWWHAFASGLTQAAFFQYRVKVLGLSLLTYLLVEAVMRLVQVPVSAISGRLGDRYGHRGVLIGGCLVTACSLLCWLRATREEWWWIWLAYALFGGWAAINVAGPNLLLRVAPRESNSLAIALFQNVAGLIAGLAGLLGGHWLEAMSPGPTAPEPYLLLFALSFAGRLLAALWLCGVREPPRSLIPVP